MISRKSFLIKTNKEKVLQGFTLVELLVVMAIISILATVMLSGFRSSQRRSRDAVRKSDLEQIGKALELFYSDYEFYPPASGGKINACPYSSPPALCTWGANDETGKMTDGKTIYFRELPEDPGKYQYYYKTLHSNTAFQLYAHLENTEDQNCVNEGCTDAELPTGVDCGSTSGPDCNFSITSANVTPKEIDE